LLKADAGSPEVPPTGDVIVPLAVWLERRQALLARNGKTGAKKNLEKIKKIEKESEKKKKRM